MTEQAKKLTVQKMGPSYRFPAQLKTHFDWVPDMDQAGTFLIGLQEMLMQTRDSSIHLLPAWPDDWDVNFKMHAPYQTTVEGTVSGGKLTRLKVIPNNRIKDVMIGKDMHKPDGAIILRSR